MKGDCNICANGKLPVTSRTCVECGLSRKNYKPITNADRIRAMTDEELAEWLDRLITHCNDGPCFNCFMQKACLTSMLDWLKHEATDGKDN